MLGTISIHRHPTKWRITFTQMGCDYQGLGRSKKSRRVSAIRTEQKFKTITLMADIAEQVVDQARVRLPMAWRGAQLHGVQSV